MQTKKIIIVPKGTQYLSEIVGAGKSLPDGLPKGVFNKSICDCGATTLALDPTLDNHKTILCSPRTNLLVNKHSQPRHKDSSYLVTPKSTLKDIESYINGCNIPKILVTYDSLPKVACCIEDKHNWRIVVDEFDFLLRDYGFKGHIERQTLQCLEEFDYITYLSATPLIDKYLYQIEEFKDIPYTELKWEKTRKIKVNAQRVGRPINAALSVIKRFMNEDFVKTICNGKVVESKECVIFLNSVKWIANLIKQSGLTPEQVNIIVSNNEENKKLIREIGEDYKIGAIPLKGEENKLITFCTSTAYAGCDFYSECASTYVICDCRCQSTAVNISNELKQIAGRQRLASNPFRDTINFIYYVSINNHSPKQYQKELTQKIANTMKTLSIFNDADDSYKQLMKQQIQSLTRIGTNRDFTIYDKTTDSLIFNKMGYVYESWMHDVQLLYGNEISVKEEMNDYGFCITEDKRRFIEEQVKCLIKRDSFRERMKRYCEAQGNPFVLSLIEETNPAIKEYYKVLGHDRIKALGYKESKLQNELKLHYQKKSIQIMLSQIFYPGVRMSTGLIKKKLSQIFDKHGILANPSAKDLELYGYHIKPIKIQTGKGKREHGYEIL